MQMATTIWGWVTHETVAKCWQYVKILPGIKAEEVPTKQYIDSDSLARYPSGHTQKDVLQTS